MTKMYCWDTTLFIALMNEEPGTPFDVIDVISDELDDGKAVLLIPTIVFAEIWEAKHSTEALKLIDAYLKNDNVIVEELSVEIARKAADIRQKIKKETGKKYKLADAIVIATALEKKADVVHALDREDLLCLSGKEIVYGMKICRPESLFGTRPLPFSSTEP